MCLNDDLSPDLSNKLYSILYEKLCRLTLERQIYLENSPGKRNYTLGRLDGQIDAIKWILSLF